MKKLFLFIISVFITSAGFGQSATAVLEAVNKKYTSFNAYSASFTLSGSNTAKGSIIAKGKKYKIDMGGQELYNNGKDVFAYSPELNEVNITSYSEGDESDFSPNNIFNLYKKGYSAMDLRVATVGGKKYDVVTLVPKTKSSIQKIELTIGKTDRLISSWTVFEKSGSTQYTITKFTANPVVSEDTFVFNKAKYPKVEIVDLR